MEFNDIYTGDTMQTGQDFIEHHGVMGQHWGKKYGPPYPLKASTAIAVSRYQRAKKKSDKLIAKAENQYSKEKSQINSGKREHYSNRLKSQIAEAKAAESKTKILQNRATSAKLKNAKSNEKKEKYQAYKQEQKEAKQASKNEAKELKKTEVLQSYDAKKLYKNRKLFTPTEYAQAMTNLAIANSSFKNGRAINMSNVINGQKKKSVIDTINGFVNTSRTVRSAVGEVSSWKKMADDRAKMKKSAANESILRKAKIEDVIKNQSKFSANELQGYYKRSQTINLLSKNKNSDTLLKDFKKMAESPTTSEAVNTVFENKSAKSAFSKLGDATKKAASSTIADVLKDNNSSVLYNSPSSDSSKSKNTIKYSMKKSYDTGKNITDEFIGTWGQTSLSALSNQYDEDKKYFH